ncbi:MAG: PAS domain S-box protein [Methanofollis sp.]|uniref:PAS domain-containing protein n=1 Tax=Methanofollis sp. TaxID=2052835 RepID=UPI00262E74F6|nr:PAS domain S-box protein [Methanofollis sp.]MDD4254059.1 PAS domain S-box protein [Methanofollis sp.]
MEKTDEGRVGAASGALGYSDPGILWQRIFDAIEDPVFIQDREGIILRANRATGNLLGVDAEEVVGKPCYAVIHQTPTFIAGCPFVRSKTSRKRERYTLWMFGRWFRVSIDPILHPEHGVIGAIHIITDVSDIKRIDELRSRLASILETSEDAIIGASAEGQVTSLNGAAVVLLGTTPDDAIGLPVSHFVPGPLFKTWEETAQAVGGGRAGRRFESEILRPDGTAHEVSVGISPIRDERSVVSGYSCLIHDLTPQRKAERALVAYVAEAALRMKVPLGGVAHEIGNVAALLDSGHVRPEDAATILRVQKAHLDQILQNLADLDRAVAESAEEIPEAYRCFLSGK